MVNKNNKINQNTIIAFIFISLSFVKISNSQIIPDFIVNNNNLKENWGPNISINDNSEIAVLWNSNHSIYLQYFNAEMLPFGGNTLVFEPNENSDSVIVRLYGSDVALQNNGNSIVVWSENKEQIYKSSYEYNIFIQLFTFDQEPIKIGNKIRINDNQNGPRTVPQICTLKDGYFMVTWTDKTHDKFGDIFAQLLDETGAKIGNNFRVNDDSGEISQTVPHIASNGTDKFVIAWRDQRNEVPKEDIYAQRYSFNDSLVKIGNNFTANNVTSDIADPSIDMNESGNFIISWRSNYHVFAQYFAYTGEPLGENLIISDDVVRHKQHTSAGISIDNNFCILWEQWEDEPKIYAQRFMVNDSILSLGGNLKISENENEGSEFSPNIGFVGENILSVWSTGSSHNIWANLIEWDYSVGIEKKNKLRSPHVVLIQNYPNPFNSQTKINYQLNKKSKITIKIYDYLGKELSTIFKGTQSPGKNELLWDASSYPSGVYFIQAITNENISTIKSLLIK